VRWSRIRAPRSAGVRMRISSSSRQMSAFDANYKVSDRRHRWQALAEWGLVPEFRLLEQLTVGFLPGMGQISLQHPREAALMPQLP
jgi:hypothetical protein